MAYYNHGADIYAASKKIGKHENSIIDFSSNINPLGLPKNVESEILDSIKYINRYPDINSVDLVKSISKYENVSEENVFVSNGAAESIFRIPIYLKPKQALVTAPTFSEYENALKVVDCQVNYYKLLEEKDFAIDADILDFIDKDIDILFICNPNNPSGQITDNRLLEKIISKCKENNTFIVIDECFIDFLENKNYYSVNHLLDKFDNIVILKAFTKIFAMPGIRLGYCLSSNKNIIEGLKKSGSPWNVSSLAQIAGITALKEKGYVENTVKYVKNQRDYLVSELSKLKIRIYPSFGNFILFKVDKKIDLQEELLKEGILIRSCANYNNLTANHYRIAVKKEEENKLFIEKLNRIWLKNE